MREGSALPGAPGAAPVPGFLAKLWALVEDPQSDDVICWSRNGENFCILDEQRFAKELLPKYFKHNNISSFIRQLNMYGFRKVVALENGMITAEKNSVIEFQHPFFKQGNAHLLENIKRKVSAVRTEDLKVCAEDLHKVLSEVQEMREQQNNMDIRLANMKRENKALWKEVAVLRQKHSQQQKLLSKILQFILSLMRGNYIVGVKRKRETQTALDPGLPICQVSQPHELDCAEPIPPVHVNDVSKSSEMGNVAVELHTAQANAPEDPVSVIDSILNENNSGNQNDPLLDREEIQDFLNCIDASLEELQAMLSGKQYSFGSEAFSDVFNPELPALDMNLMETSPGMENVRIANLEDSTEDVGASERETAGSKDMQLIQYRANPLLSLFEELPSGEAGGKTEDPKDLLLAPLEEKPALHPSSGSETANQAEPSEDTLGVGDPPLLSEDGNGEYKLFPLLLLSPVANFIEEASEIETS
ncbi:UNVERIFIED_CONTAM: hypothetical protein H355_010955 [Colinus virginianus]|nr:hypothetical protein H355_010955 [Colinus virginianus]